MLNTINHELELTECCYKHLRNLTPSRPNSLMRFGSKKEVYVRHGIDSLPQITEWSSGLLILQR
jgi:hypothetical protein